MQAHRLVAQFEDQKFEDAVIDRQASNEELFRKLMDDEEIR